MYEEDEIEDYILINYVDCTEKNELGKNPLSSTSHKKSCITYYILLLSKLHILATHQSISGVVKLSNDDDFRNFYRTFELTFFDPKIRIHVGCIQ